MPTACSSRLEEWYASAYRHRHSLPDPGQLLWPLHLCHSLHGRLEEGLCCHGGPPHHHTGAHLLLLCLQVLLFTSIVKNKQKTKILLSSQTECNAAAVPSDNPDLIESVLLSFSMCLHYHIMTQSRHTAKPRLQMH